MPGTSTVMFIMCSAYPSLAKCKINCISDVYFEQKMDISQSSTIVKRGTVDNIVTQANILGGRKKPTTKPIHCIVFTEKVLLAKERVKG